MSLSYNYPPQVAYPSAPPVYRAFPAPPRLHWAWVLVLSIVTFGVFWALWMTVQGWWVKKATGNSKAFAWSLAYAVFLVGTFLAAIVGSVYFAFWGQAYGFADFRDKLMDLRSAVGFLLYIASVYLLKSGLESSPIKISLHGLATLFFGPVYFQYYLRKYSVEGKPGEQLSGFEEQAVAGTVGGDGLEAPRQI